MTSRTRTQIQFRQVQMLVLCVPASRRGTNIAEADAALEQDSRQSHMDEGDLLEAPEVAPERTCQNPEGSSSHLPGGWILVLHRGIIGPRMVAGNRLTLKCGSQLLR